jgi:hypothetical protein
MIGNWQGGRLNAARNGSFLSVCASRRETAMLFFPHLRLISSIPISYDLTNAPLLVR